MILTIKILTCLAIIYGMAWLNHNSRVRRAAYLISCGENEHDAIDACELSYCAIDEVRDLALKGMLK